MSVSKPQNREEFKAHILSKLGAPVLEINVADEQLDIAIDDSFQYFNERNHFNGVERAYLTARPDSIYWRRSYNTPVYQDPPENTRTMTVGRSQNFLILPDDVVGVTKILSSRGNMGGIGGGVVPPGIIFPGLIGNISGQGCDNTGFGLVTYYAMMEYMSLIEFMFFPPKMYNFNQRTHRLHIDGDLDRGGMLCMECMIKPNPDIFPDLWNDMWLKEFATAMVKAQWGRNLTKYSGVQLPGGITMNGDRILGDAQEELKILKDRFAMDWADPCLDEVG